MLKNILNAVRYFLGTSASIYLVVAVVGGDHFAALYLVLSLVNGAVIGVIHTVLEQRNAKQ